MTAVEDFIHLPTAVQAMRLLTLADAQHAHDWLTAHHVAVATRIGHRGGHLIAVSPGGSELSIDVGQWLVYCPATGHFTAYEDAEFRALHRRPSPAPEVAA